MCVKPTIGPDTDLFKDFISSKSYDNFFISINLVLRTSMCNCNGAYDNKLLFLKCMKWCIIIYVEKYVKQSYRIVEARNQGFCNLYKAHRDYLSMNVFLHMKHRFGNQ